MCKYSFCLLVFAFSIVELAAQENTPKWISEGPFVVEGSFTFELPLETLANKLFVEVEIGGAPRRFVFDTGSPTMMSATLASEMGLEVIDKRQGKDAHGAIVDTDIVQTDLTLGGVTFHSVPVFVADFSSSKAECLMDGVLGSEVLPLCAWQIDLPGAVLRCNTELERLDHIRDATRQHLYDFGYPHAPILDVGLADNAKSKALFDTGSSEYFTISPPDFDGAKRNDGIGKTTSGFGSSGTSAGGPAPDREQLKVELKSLSVGNIQLGRVLATVREMPPSLVGSSILEHFIVTLDSGSESAYFKEYREGPFIRPSFGFSLGFEEEVSVALVWKDSPAADAELRTGQHVTSINSRATDTSCDGIRSALRAMAGDTIELEWEAGAAVLSRHTAGKE